MILNSGDPPKATLPQLHVNDKVHSALPAHTGGQTAQQACQPTSSRGVPVALQFLGDTHTIQELEDFGELDDALMGLQ